MCCMLNKFEEGVGRSVWLAFTRGTIWPRLLYLESRSWEGATLLGEFPTEATEEIPESESSCCTLATNLGLT
jgi:hypothetical protein